MVHREILQGSENPILHPRFNSPPPSLSLITHAPLAGLSIGLQAIARIQPGALCSGTQYALEQLAQYQNLSDRILEFWLVRENQQRSSWSEHADINDVMLATALQPRGYLGDWERVVL